MTREAPLMLGSLLANVDMETFRWRFGKLVENADGTPGYAVCGAGDRVDFVIADDVDAGDPGLLHWGGVTEVYAAGTIAVGDLLVSAANGRAAVSTNGQGFALALSTATVGSVCTILLITKNMGDSAPQLLAAPGAVSLTSRDTHLAVDGTDAFTLADGLYAGQPKRIRCTAAANTPLGTLTIATPYSGTPAAFVFTTVNQEIELIWDTDGTDGWRLVNMKQIGVETVANAGTANPLCLLHLVAIADTVDFIQGAGVIAGQRSIWFANANSGTPVGTVSGLFYDEDGSADGIDLALNAAGDQATLSWIGGRWFAESLVSTTVAP